MILQVSHGEEMSKELEEEELSKGQETGRLLSDLIVANRFLELLIDDLQTSRKEWNRILLNVLSDLEDVSCDSIQLSKRKERRGEEKMNQ